MRIAFSSVCWLECSHPFLVLLRWNSQAAQLKPLASSLAKSLVDQVQALGEPLWIEGSIKLSILGLIGRVGNKFFPKGIAIPFLCKARMLLEPGQLWSWMYSFLLTSLLGPSHLVSHWVWTDLLQNETLRLERCKAIMAQVFTFDKGPVAS